MAARATILLMACLLIGCSTAKYRVLDPNKQDEKGHMKELQSLEADAPGGDAYVIVVYYGPRITPNMKGGGDSSELVQATAAAGRQAIELIKAAAAAAK